MRGFGSELKDEMLHSLLPPGTPAELPHGLQRGGIFAAPWGPQTYIDMRRPTVPTNSPATHNVQKDVFGSKIGFQSAQTVRKITGGPGGMGSMAVTQPVYPRPIQVRPIVPVQVPHGAQEGGIFGNRVVKQGMKVGPGVPQRLPMNGVFGGSPDGLG